jgi:hypothetical protein
MINYLIYIYMSAVFYNTILCKKRNFFKILMTKNSIKIFVYSNDDVKLKS